ncbi:MAG: Crp/Fnr family transcriptional regulator [Bacteroidota bacterium]|nr:Crp/Fnr family transcriptional regulator [Bacteroidota bacterium]
MEKSLAHSDFQSIQIFQGLSALELEKILTKLIYRVRFYAEGELIMQRGDEVTAFMAVFDGDLIGEMQVSGANDLRVEHLLPGQLIASAILFSEKNLLPVDLIARRASRVLFISKTDFLSLLKENETILLNFLKIVSEKGPFLANKLHFLMFSNLKQKVAAYILEQCGSDYLSFEMNGTQEELARLFGVARTSLIRAMQTLQNDGIIEIDRKWIKCLDKERLKEL